MKRRILIVEDEERIAFWVRSFFIKAGFEADVSGDGRVGLERILAERPDLVILDRMLPGLDGLSVLRRLREVSNVPVILLTALDAEGERVKGLRGGADDYVCKPFSPQELVARAEALLRRARGNVRQVLQIGGVVLDIADRTCSVRGQPVELSRAQFDLLAALMSRPGKVFRREELIEAALGRDFDGFDRAVDVHMRRLRSRIEIDPSAPLLLQTVHGVGYRFNPDLKQEEAP